jgi:hypothetical protein
MKTDLFLALFIVLSLNVCGQSGPKKHNPATTQQTTAASDTPPASSQNPTINVYIENSGSMYGYVNGDTEFKRIIYNYLTAINTSNMASHVNISYINTRVFPQSTDVSQFIRNDKLDPQKFPTPGGGSTDVANIIDSILSRTTSRTISILVSDCIFSPGATINASQYLINQQNLITLRLSRHLSTHANTAVIIYQLSSQFTGIYYNKNDQPTSINARRPFYIWVIGDAEHLAKLREKVPENTFQSGGVQNYFSITQGNRPIGYAIRLGSGNFHIDHENPTHIINARINSHGQNNGFFTFSVNANFSSFLLDDAYLSNRDNYQLSNNDYQLTISRSPSNSLGYTHSLNLSSPHIHSGALSIRLTPRIPAWVNEINDDNGFNIHAPGAMQKTYGFRHLIQGVYGAYTSGNDHYYTNINININ